MGAVAWEIRSTSADVLEPLRRRVLRGGRADLEARLPEDDLPGTVHLGAFAAGDGRPALLLGGVTLVERAWPDAPDVAAYRLSLMAVEPAYQGTGVGAALVRAAQSQARQGARGLWANARDSAVGFYERLGFRSVGAGFVGPMQLPHHQVQWGGDGFG